MDARTGSRRAAGRWCFSVSLGVVLAVAAPAQAALRDRGSGLIYDDDLNITWLADANYAQTSGYDADGRMTWAIAMNWVANLTYYDSVRDVTYSDWRLPVSDFCSYINCTGSEMGHLFYLELGGVGTFDISTTYNSNYSLFHNVPEQADYWSGTGNFGSSSSLVWGFDFDNGVQSLQGNPSPTGQYGEEYAWALRTGDVVPEPASFLLVGTGLSDSPEVAFGRLNGVVGDIAVKQSGDSVVTRSRDGLPRRRPQDFRSCERY
jgi:hypothetical protein